MNSKLKFLLLQIRKPTDDMRAQELEAFCEALSCDPQQIDSLDLVYGDPSPSMWKTHDMVMIGGSGDFSVVTGGPWLPRALECMAELAELRKPTFASCWGFQALSRALGGKVVTDLDRAEIGTPELTLTESGIADPVFGILPHVFHASMGHQDIVDRLPTNGVLLASSPRVENEAFRIANAPIYATQFHPELRLRHLMQRLKTYPEYIEKIAGVSPEEFAKTVRETPEANMLLSRMVDVVFG